MKKVLLTAMALLTIASASAFGMYGVDGDDWIGFLVQGNQFRARMDQLGFVLGNGTVKGTVGLRADTGWMGKIIGTGGKSHEDESHAFEPTASVGIGYTSDIIGIGVGYNFTYIDRYVHIHTPTLVLNALNNNLRLAVPIQVAVADNIYESGIKYTGVGFNNIELRYFTGVDAFNAVRFYASYKKNTYEILGYKEYQEAFALQLRLYFLKTTVGNVTVNPYIRIDYNHALYGSYTGGFLTIADNYFGATRTDVKNSDIYDVSPFRVFVKPVLSLTASSDILTLYFEPSLGYAVSSSKLKGASQKTTHALNWGAYTEFYIRPVQDLEWYFEMDVNGNVNGKYKVANSDLPPVSFETTTGITWYLPEL